MQTCSNCQHQNPDDVQFCGQCGTRLERLCPHCGKGNPLGNRFCYACGQSMVSPAEPASESRSAASGAHTPPRPAAPDRAARPAMERERKQVTVLFTDLSNSTAISERLDPEEMHGLVNRCFDLMLAEVHRYEGTLTDFTGDGLMAIFGAPIAHEDHAQRAVLAALAIQQALAGYHDDVLRTRGIDFRMRCGLNTGLVVVGSFSDDLQTRYTATGDKVNVAARMLTIAGPGEVVITEDTYRAVGDYFVTEPLGERAIKGKSQPIGAYRVLRARAQRTRMDASLEHGLTPYVGRKHELAILTDRFERAREGHGQIVCLMGEPGIGKSRLLLEFHDALDATRMTWLTGRCISYGQSIAYVPLIDLAKQAFGVREEDDEAAIITKIERGMQTLGTELQAHAPFVKYLLSVNPGDESVATMDPQSRRIRIFEALRALVIASAERTPLVLAVEDLHWMDKTSEEFLLFLAESIGSCPLLLLLTYRPGYANPLPENTYTTRLVVPTLSADESAHLAEGALATREIPVALRELIARKAEGNPFFVEEMLKSLMETRALVPDDGRYVLAKPPAEIYVPDRVQDVIMARIDRLAEEPRHALQLASVIGREFTARLLGRISDVKGRLEKDLLELKVLEFIYERHLHPELAYMFKHAMTHDVAYGSLLIQRRQDLHALVARAIEELYAERLPEHYETLAYHYEQGEQWDKALEYLLKAAQKLQQGYAIREALVHFERALAVSTKTSKDDIATQVQIQRGIGGAYFALGEFTKAIEQFQQMLEVARRSSDRQIEAEALFQIGYSLVWNHEFEKALEYAECAKAVATNAGIPQLVAAGSMVAGVVFALTGKLAEARLAYKDVISTSRALNDRELLATVLSHLGHVQSWQGEFRQSRASTEEGSAIGQQHGLFYALNLSFWSTGLALGGAGDYQAAIEVLTRGLTLSRRVGDRVMQSRDLNTLAWIYGELQDLKTALRYNREALEVAPQDGVPELARNAQINLGDNYFALGDLSETRHWLETTYGEIQRRGTWGEDWMKWRYSQHACHSLGELRMAEGKPSEALALAEECLKTAEETQSRKNIVKGHRLKGQALLALGKPEDARDELERALAVAEEIGNPPQLWKTHAALGDWHRAQGDAAQAQASYANAVRMIDGVASRLQDEELKRTFLSAAPVVALRAAAQTSVSA